MNFPNAVNNTAVISKILTLFEIESLVIEIVVGLNGLHLMEVHIKIAI